MREKTLRVTAADGRLVPLHPGDMTAPGGRLRMVEPGEVVEVPNSPGIRRRIRAGDLVVVKESASRAATTAPLPKAPPARRFDDSDVDSGKDH